MKSSAPASSAGIFSADPDAVIMTTGMCAIAASARICRHTSYPSMPGIWTSSSTRSGGSPLRAISSAAAPDSALRT